MKILHTSDWHLGHKLLFNDRQQEHELALDWLYDTIVKEDVDCLLVAGDIFDIGNPPNYARKMYYGFLTRLLSTQCRHIVITGGNHDSPSMLDAPRALLEHLNVQVLGAATGNPEDELLLLKDSAGQLEAVVAAVPFLRDRDLRYSVSGETGTERLQRVREAIVAHYKTMGELAAAYEKQNVPVIAMGHLYATGAEASGKQDNIYIGDTENIRATEFPDVFDYVALGHIHRAQAVGGLDKVRYCGSIIPLSFSETKDEKGVLLVCFKEKRLNYSKFIPVPVSRRLKTIQGTLEEVKERLTTFAVKERQGLTPWVEVIIDSEKWHPHIDQELRKYVEELPLELLKIRLNRPHRSLEQQVEDIDLEELTPFEVFQKRCAGTELPAEELQELEEAFKELLF